LAAKYDVNELGKVSTINSNFAKASRSDLFWWEIIRLKFPQYYKEKRNYNYDPRELIIGLNYFSEKVEIFGEKDITMKMLSKLKQYTIYKTIDKFYLAYYQTFKYVILEDIWIYYKKVASLIIAIIVEMGKFVNFDTDLQILKTFVKKCSFNDKIVSETEGINFNGFKLTDELNKWLFSQDKNQILQDLEIVDVLNYDLRNKYGSFNPEYYEYLSSKLNRPATDQRYLEDYFKTHIYHDNLQDYMLSRI